MKNSDLVKRDLHGEWLTVKRNKSNTSNAKDLERKKGKDQFISNEFDVIFVIDQRKDIRGRKLNHKHAIYVISY